MLTKASHITVQLQFAVQILALILEEQLRLSPYPPLVGGSHYIDSVCNSVLDKVSIPIEQGIDTVPTEP